MKFLRTLLAVGSLAFATISANAAVQLVVDNGILTGAKGVNVDGTLYDVTFRDGTCISLFSGCDSPTDFPFGTQESATNAAAALLDQVFLDGPEGDFDSFPGLTSGCENPPPAEPTFLCRVGVPYALAGNVVHAMYAFNWHHLSNFPYLDEVLDDLGSPSFDSTGRTSLVNAVWTTPSSIPEPGAPALIALGLAAMSVTRSRRDRNRLRDV